MQNQQSALSATGCGLPKMLASEPGCKHSWDAEESLAMVGGGATWRPPEVLLSLCGSRVSDGVAGA